MNTTTFVAWWGAVIATVSLAWNIVRDLRNRGKLKLDAMFGTDVRQPHLAPVLTVRITNVGTKPVMVQGMAAKVSGVQSETKDFFFTCRTIPKMLAPGEFTVEVFDRSGRLPADLTEVYAWDSTGKRWKLGRKEVQSLLEAQGRLPHVRGE